MQINLLPEQLKKRKTVELAQDFKRLILSFVFVWLILGSLWLILALKISDYKRKLSEVEAEWQTTQPVLAERDLLAQEKKVLNAFLIFLKQNIKKGISWSEKLTVLSNLIPEEAWFNEISLRKEKGEEQENAFLDVLASVGYLKTDEDMLNKINELYSIPSYPDLAIENVSVLMHGRYFNSNFTIRNIGLKESEGLKVKIYADEDLVKEMDVKGLKAGTGMRITLENFFINKISVKEFKFLIDSPVKELEEENNEIILKVKS
jgi:Tfp pilus assembly protein PilN